MTIDPTTTTTAASAAATSGVTGRQSNALGKDAFMKLLITQLMHQDPTKPQDDTALIAQLAQFSTLEQLTQIQKTLEAIGGALGVATTRPPA